MCRKTNWKQTRSSWRVGIALAWVASWGAWSIPFAVADESACVSTEVRASLSLSRVLHVQLIRDSAAYFLNELRRDRESFYKIEKSQNGTQEKILLNWDPTLKVYEDPRPLIGRRWTLAEFAQDLHAGKIEAAPNQKGVENYGHIRRLYERVLKHRAELAREQVRLEDLVTGILASDLGKTRLREIIALYRSGKLKLPGIEREWTESDFFAAFLRHEDYGKVLLRDFMLRRGRELGLEDFQTEGYYRNACEAIDGHNGPATPRSFWKRVHEALGLGPYPDPVDREAWVHALGDRTDGVLLMLSHENGRAQLVGGPRKILYEILNNPKDERSFSEKVVEAFVTNPNLTLEQMDHLMALAKTEPTFHGLAQLDYTKECFEDVRSTQKKILKLLLIRNGVVSVRTTTGHWKNVYDPEALLELFAESWNHLK